MSGATPLNLARIHFPVHTLGPGRRLGIWLQGCSIRCPGCISVDTWAPDRGATTVAAVLAAVAPWLEQADGVTISGGEPFDQQAALFELLAGLRRTFAGDLLIYSGYPVEQLDLGALGGLADALISDPLRLDWPQTLALRGSDNQRLHLLSPLGRQRFAAFERPVAAGESVLEVMFGEEGEVFLAGIPRRGDFTRLAALLAADGHRVLTSEDPGSAA